MTADTADVLAAEYLAVVFAAAEVVCLSADNAANVVTEVLIADFAVVFTVLNNSRRISRNAAGVGYVCKVLGGDDVGKVNFFYIK